jgi:NDP-sugar pyrophosphorylase family protein
MILAAGEGTRLRPLTLFRPKPLVPVVNRPLLGILIEQLKKAGATQIIVNTHYLAHQIRDFLNGGAPFGIPITLRHEERILGTGGGIKNTEDFWEDEPFIVLNGDILHTVDLRKAYDTHLKEGNLVSLVLHRFPRYNHVHIDEDRNIVAIREKKPKSFSGKTHQVAFTGIHILSPEVLRDTPPGKPLSILDIYLERIAKGEHVRGIIVENHYWNDLGTPEDYVRAHQDVLKGRLNVSDHELTDISGQVVDGSTVLGEKTQLKGLVCIGKGTRIGGECSITDSILWQNVQVGDGVTVERCVLGDDVRVSHSLTDVIPPPASP